jgi:hypothetical protein
LPKCIVCDKDMGKEATECDLCGDSIHQACIAKGCPTCEEVAERAAMRAAQNLPKPGKTKTKPVPSPKEPEPKPVTSPRPKPKAVATEEEFPLPLDFMPTVNRASEPKPTDKVIYTKGEWHIIIGLQCPKGGRKQTIEARFETDPDGYRGQGNTEEEAKELLFHYAFGTPCDRLKQP